MNPREARPLPGLCLLCAQACYWQSRYSTLITMAESSVNLLILLAGVMVPIVHPENLAGDTAVDAGISGYNMVNFLLTDEWRLTQGIAFLYPRNQ